MCIISLVKKPICFLFNFDSLLLVFLFAFASRALSQDAETHYASALKKEFVGDSAGAVVDFNAAIELKRDWPEAYNNRGISKAELGDFDGALADQDMAIKLNPSLAWAYYCRGFLHYDRQDFSHSLTDFKMFCQLNLKVPRTFRDFAFGLFRRISGLPPRPRWSCEHI